MIPILGVNIAICAKKLLLISEHLSGSLSSTNLNKVSSGLTGNISVGGWQIALLFHFRRAKECSCKSTLKICQLEFYLTSFTNAKLFPSFTVERKVFSFI